MKSQGLFPDNCEKSRKWKSYVSAKKEPVNTAPNLLKSPITGEVEFFALRLLEKICLDISEFKFSNSKLYMFAYIDVYSRLPLKTYFSSNQTTKELIKSLYILKNNYNINNSIIHTDRGAQFRSINMMNFCKANKIKQSMTDGYALWQNAIVETFFNSFKQNHLKGYKFSNIKEFLTWMENCIWNYSNNRIVNKLKITPIEMYKSNLLK